MSRLRELQKDLSILPDILAEYEADIEGSIKNITIDSKTLGLANKENPSWLLYYSMRRAEVGAILKFMEVKVEKIKGSLFRKFTENNQRELSDRAKFVYIESENAYLTRMDLYLEVKEVYDKYDALVEAFRSRGYALNNLTRLRIESMENEAI